MTLKEYYYQTFPSDLALLVRGFEPQQHAGTGRVFARKRLGIPRLYSNSFTRCPPRSAARTKARSKTSVGWSIPSVQT
jgi:hypothetical protein